MIVAFAMTVPLTTAIFRLLAMGLSCCRGLDVRVKRKARGSIRNDG